MKYTELNGNSPVKRTTAGVKNPLTGLDSRWERAEERSVTHPQRVHTSLKRPRVLGDVPLEPLPSCPRLHGHPLALQPGGRPGALPPLPGPLHCLTPTSSSSPLGSPPGPRGAHPLGAS